MNLTSLPAVSIGISIVICWGLFAIACSIVHESIVRLIAERGKFMQKYLLKQFEDAANNTNWATKLYQQGPVTLLSRDTKKKPSDDIDPTLFSRCIVAAVAGIAKPPLPGPIAGGNPTLLAFRAAVAALNTSSQADLFRNCLADASGNSDSDYEKLLANLGNWFTEFGQRITLWYKKLTQVRLLILGCLFAFVVNVDSIQLFTVFRDDPTARTAIQEFYAKNKTNLENLAHNPDTAATAQIIKKYDQKIDTLQKQAALPIGIRHNCLVDHTDHGWFWLLKILGLLLSGFAAGMGAPYWFDLLKKVNIPGGK